LRQAAGFEARRHDEGIRTGLNEVGEGFVVADQNRYPTRIRFRGRLKAILRIRISTSKQRKLHSFVHDGGNVLKKKIGSLLPGQPTYDAEQKRIRRWIVKGDETISCVAVACLWRAASRGCTFGLGRGDF
jgi:hypothetical protein